MLRLEDSENTRRLQTDFQAMSPVMTGLLRAFFHKVVRF
jgi:hypothetical protein